MEVVSGRGTSRDCHVNLGEIASGMRVKTKISVYNSGLRIAFVSASCCPGMVDIHVHVYSTIHVFYESLLTPQRRAN